MDEAIEVLRAAVERSGRAKQTRAEVRLALKALRFVGIPAEAIRYIWEACGSDNEIGRSQNMSSAPRRIGIPKRSASSGLVALTGVTGS